MEFLASRKVSQVRGKEASQAGEEGAWCLPVLGAWNGHSVTISELLKEHSWEGNVSAPGGYYVIGVGASSL